MSAFGMLVVLIGIWVVINAINGNLYGVIPSPLGDGTKKFNFKF